jgi:hypothetical protein
MAIDNEDNLYIAIELRGAEVTETCMAEDENSGVSGPGIAIVKLNSNGESISSINWNGVGYMDLPYVAVNDRKEIFVAGSYSRLTDLDPSRTVSLHTSSENRDLFIEKFNSDGSLQWIHTWGGSWGDIPFAIATDKLGNALVAAWISNADFIDKYSLYRNDDGRDFSAFLCNIDANGEVLWCDTW